jgi:Zn-dependent M28 family amino/carboxypeptidase
MSYGILIITLMLPCCVLMACGAPDDSDGKGAGGPDGSTSKTQPLCSRPPLAAPWLRTLLTSSTDQLASMPRATNVERMNARTFIKAQLKEFGWTPMSHDYVGGTNVYATIPATMGGAGKEIIVGAHFDSVTDSPGANDNASGVAVVLSIARYLVEVPCRSAPVTVVFFDQEELGLLGSLAFSLQRDPKNVAAVHTIDQVAWDEDGDHLFELESPTVELEAKWRAAARVVGVPVIVTNTEDTDHEAFRNRGFAAIGLTEGYASGDTTPFVHETGDTTATINIDYLVLAAQLAGEVIVTDVTR